MDFDADVLAAPLELPCGVVLKNRLAKAAMSDSLADGAGRPTDQQVALYRRWSTGGAALSLIGEVQVDYRYPERPGNLVLWPGADDARLARLANVGSTDGAQIWPQLGHAGALAYGPISRPAGPSAFNMEGLECDALTRSAVDALPATYARAAAHARAVGFNGVEIHAGHGFLLSQFLSPLFNRRSDHYGGSIEARCRLLLAVVREVRAEVGSEFAIAVKINSSDQLEGGLDEDDALVAVSLLGDEGVDLIDISGGTYFPGAPASSDRRSWGPYFLEFARRARTVTDTPLMVTGGFKTRCQAAEAVATGAADIVGLARAMALDPDVAAKWLRQDGADPQFPRFESRPAGGVTAWFTMRLTALAYGDEDSFKPSLSEAIEAYEARDTDRVATWERTFGVRSRPATSSEEVSLTST
ncbi:MAG: oxidoreductase [bacterium]|nr:oxidoreductase [bacterium]MDE0351556.1 oxidoreductase [bacterium]